MTGVHAGWLWGRFRRFSTQLRGTGRGGCDLLRLRGWCSRCRRVGGLGFMRDMEVNPMLTGESYGPPVPVARSPSTTWTAVSASPTWWTRWVAGLPGIHVRPALSRHSGPAS